MISKDEGGPAFPQGDLSKYEIGPDLRGMSGMSLRDYFAGQALVGMMPELQREDTEYGEAAEMVYRMADAMLKARQQ